MREARPISKHADDERGESGFDATTTDGGAGCSRLLREVRSRDLIGPIRERVKAVLRRYTVRDLSAATVVVVAVADVGWGRL